MTEIQTLGVILMGLAAITFATMFSLAFGVLVVEWVTLMSMSMWKRLYVVAYLPSMFLLGLAAYLIGG
jgi:hypothetical protein